MNLLKLAAKRLPIEYVDEKTRAVRYGICKGCEKYDPEKDKCQVCGCFMEIKSGAKIHFNPAELRTEVTHCPLGKWFDKDLANEYRKIDRKPLIE